MPRPAVSVSGGVSEPDDVAAVDSGAHGLPLSADVDLALFDGGFGISSSADPDSFVLEAGFLDSPDSGSSEFNYLVDNEALPPLIGAGFDINDFLNSDETQQTSGFDVLVGSSGSLGTGEPSSLNLETEDASKDPDQQPHAGASSGGCDDAGIAVGVF